MELTTLRLEVSGQLFYLDCLPYERMEVGSDPDCKISLDVEDVLPQHCIVERSHDDTFTVGKVAKYGRFDVNGVVADEMRVRSPFTLRVASHKIKLALVEDAEAEQFRAQANPNHPGAVLPKGFNGNSPDVRKRISAES